MSIKKIAIIGNAGSGKSTLAQQIANITHLPVYHLDQYFWKPNWTYPNMEEYLIIHHDICDKDAWIIDGMNLRLLEYRIMSADVVIFLNVPRYLCFWRIFKRMFKYYGKETPSSAAGCKEGIRWEFARFLKWVWDFQTRYPQRINELFADYADQKKLHIFRSQKEVDRFLDTLQKK